MTDLPDLQAPRNLSLGLDSPDFMGGNEADLAMPLAGQGAQSFGAAATPSLNLAPAAAPAALPAEPSRERTVSDQDFLSELSTGQKIGLAMQEFAAGFQGRPSVIDKILEQKHRREKETRETLVNNINVLQKGTEILRKMPQGSLQRQAVAEELGKIVGPKFAPLFNAVGSDHEDALNN